MRTPVEAVFGPFIRSVIFSRSNSFMFSPNPHPVAGQREMPQTTISPDVSVGIAVVSCGFHFCGAQFGSGRCS